MRKQTPIGEMFMLWRSERHMGVREMAKIIGVSPATLNRIERGYPMDTQTLMKLLAWMLAATTDGK